MSKSIKVLIILGIFVLAIILAFLIFVTITISQITENINLNPSKLSNINTQIQIFDDKNSLITTTSASGNMTITLTDLPEYVPQAFISIEDKDFYKHNGLNIKRMIKACINNIVSGYAKEGASTITQQLIKNTHLSSEKTFKRKIQEIYLAKKLEQIYSKNQILETYLNVIYFGNGVYGIESASQTYFGHSATQLTVSESAILAGLIKSPGIYNPTNDNDKCLNRRNLVLKNMLQDNYIDNASYAEAINTPISTTLNNNNQNYLNKAILNEAMNILNLNEKDVSTNGYKIYTYIDNDLQNEIQDIVPHLDNIDDALILIDNKTNGVVCYVGNCNVNRQVGSLIKPFVCYAPAFETGILSPITPILDNETTFGDFKPKNANNKYSGWVSTRTALAKSLNIPAVKTLEYTGINKSIKIASKFGLNFTANDNHLAIALGAKEYGENLATITNCYSTLARNGAFAKLNFIKKIVDSNNHIVYQNSLNTQQIIGDDTAFLLNDILKNSVTDGTAKRLSTLPFTLSAKTGTVGSGVDNTNTDAWCVAYNPQYIVGAWYGNTTGDKQFNLLPTQNGGTIATNLNKLAWDTLSKHYLINQTFTPPDSVTKVQLDSMSLEQQKLELTTPNTPDIYKIEDYFSKKYIPNKYSTNFTEITPPVLNLKATDQILLTWDAKQYLTYDLYANDTLIKTFTAKNETIQYTLPTPNANTEYYLKCYLNNQKDTIQKSNVVSYSPKISSNINLSPKKRFWFF